MRHRMILAALLLAALMAPAPSRANEVAPWSGSVLVGYGRYSDRFFFPNDSLADGALFGARLSRRIGGYWSVEGAASVGPTHELRRDGTKGSSVTVTGASLSLTSQLSEPNAFGSLYLLGGLGWHRQQSSPATTTPSQATLEAALGWTLPVNEHWSWRLEARNLLNLPKGNLGGANQADQQFWAGLTYRFAGKPKDTDGDGVIDRLDQCPDTPRGATVNASGCPRDSDHDGVLDGLDTCPDTPAGATVDAKGCPSDSDNDGVPDGIDTCPNTPAGATVDAKGCPIDSDGDGVPDGLDRCANTPRGATVDASGCPTDSDGDGVPDGLDQCADTPHGLKVDDKGCPLASVERETELLDTGMIRLNDVNFATKSTTLDDASQRVLDEVGVILTRWPQLRVEIGGHTDDRGSDKANQKLSEGRAKAVRDYLTQRFPGLDAKQLTTKGYGESKPLTKNRTDRDRAKNRRVEFKVMNREVLKQEIERRGLQKR